MKGTAKFYTVYFTDNNTGKEHEWSTWNDPNSNDENIRNGLNRVLTAIAKFNGTVDDILIIEEE